MMYVSELQSLASLIEKTNYHIMDFNVFMVTQRYDFRVSVSRFYLCLNLICTIISAKQRKNRAKLQFIAKTNELKDKQRRP